MRRWGKRIIWGLLVASVPLTLVTTWVFIAIFPDNDVALFFACGGKIFSIDTFADRGDESLEGGFYMAVRSFSPWPVSFGPRIESGAVEANTEIPAIDVEPGSNRIWIDKEWRPVLRPREAIASENHNPDKQLTPQLRIQTLIAIPFYPALLIGWIMPIAMFVRVFWLRRRRIFDAFFSPRSFN